MEIVKLTNMCKIINPETGKVLVQERIKSWKGIAFPGGKINLGESIVQSVKREIFEETGLKISDLKLCGMKDWYDTKSNERYVVFLYQTDKFEGVIIDETYEGKNYWITEEELKQEKLADDFDKVLKIYNNDNLSEMFYYDNKNENENIRWDLYFY